MFVIEFDQKCKACKGTGLYVGMAEKDGAAVVCYECKGTGCKHIKMEYEPFTVRQIRNNVKRVYQANPGIGIGEGNGYTLYDFGGISHNEWLTGNPEWVGTENRKFTCPAWWYQCVDYSKKPEWKECIVCGSFSQCGHFSEKAKCWDRLARNE
jgi:hypothetical protein